MKKNRVWAYSSFLLAAMLCIAGCGEAAPEGQDDNTLQMAGEENVYDPAAEEYFNSLLDLNSSAYQQTATETVEEPEEDTKEPEEINGALVVGPLTTDNEYAKAIPVGKSCIVDLNSDGVDDVITFNAVVSATAEYGTAVESFTINDGDYKYTLFLSDQGIHIQDPDLKWYYITDINTRDSYKEIALLDHGANGIPYTYFIRYTGAGTYCLGYVPYFPDDEYFHVRGDGSVESAVEMNLLQNWKAPAVWVSGSDQMISSNLSMRDIQIYNPYEDQYADDVVQLIDLKLYKTRNLNGDTVEAKASDSPVIFTQTDNSHWVYMKREDEVAGWFYMEDANTIVNNGTKYNRREVFQNLY